LSDPERVFMARQFIYHMSGLNKAYGNTKILENIHLSFYPDAKIGILGPNGAGKSTTIRVLLGLLRKSGGEATLLGGDPWSDAVALHRRLAYVPGDVNLWPQLTGGACTIAFATMRRRRMPPESVRA
jgi:ABC-2 type transport system ATP-binding protein